ncbi:MAG: secondary thiamine-phosphate synthase enzyme YjbQ [Candidatus Hydrothermarchaeales archaeon]
MASKILSVNTKRKTQFLDLTGEVEKFVGEAGVKEGLLNIYTRHTTTGVIINENETGLLRDLERLFDTLAPKGSGYEHDRIDDNADSHLRAVLCGGSKSIPIYKGRLQLGTWQRVFLAEFDGPRKREVMLQVIGE